MNSQQHLREAFDWRMLGQVIARGGTTGPDHEGRLQAGGMGGIKLSDDIAEEQDLCGWELEIRGDFAVAFGFFFGAGRRVVMPAEVREQISSNGVAEKQLLCLHAARGINPDVFAGSVPGG